MKRLLITPSLAFSLLLLWAVIILAQAETGPVQAEWIVGDPPESGWTIGDQIPIRLRATYPETLPVTLPTLSKSWGPFEVLDQSLAAPINNGDGTLTRIRSATIIPWTPGDHPLPLYTVRYHSAAGAPRSSPAPSLTLTIVSVLNPNDTAMRDLKPQVDLPRPPVWPWLLGGLAGVILAGVTTSILWSRLRRRRVVGPVPQMTIEPRPPHAIALSELDRIAALNLPAKGELQRHYTLVSDCLRSYIHKRYHIQAMDQTTSELLNALRQAHVDRRHTSRFHDMLSSADLVKFARLCPPIDQADLLVDQARQIVDATKPLPEPDAPMLTRTDDDRREQPPR